MIKKYKLLMFIIFLGPLFAFSNTNIIYVAENPHVKNADGLNICTFDHEHGRVEKCTHPQQFESANINSIAINPKTYTAYITVSGTNLLYSCFTNHETGDLIGDCRAIVISHGGKKLGGMAFSSDGTKLYLADQLNHGIRVCLVGLSTPTNGCPLMKNIYGSESHPQFSFPSSVAVVEHNTKILVADPLERAVLSCHLENDGNTLGDCSKMNNKYIAPRDIAVNQNRPNNVFIASGYIAQPSIVCNTHDYEKFSHCNSYNFMSRLDVPYASTAVTTSFDGNYAFFVIGDNHVISTKIGNNADLVQKDIQAKFYGDINAIAAYN